MNPQIKKTFKEINTDLDRLVDFALNPKPNQYKEVKEIHKRTVENLKAVEFNLIRK